MTSLVLNPPNGGVQCLQTVSFGLDGLNVDSGPGGLLVVFQRDISGNVGWQPHRSQVVLGKSPVELIVLSSPPEELVGEAVHLAELSCRDGQGSPSHLRVGQIVAKFI